MIEKIFTGGIPFLKKLLMKQAMKKSKDASGIMSINKNLVRDVDNTVKKWVESAKSQGQDIDKMSEQELKYLIELNKPKGPTIGGHRVIDASSSEGQGITRDFFNMLDRQSGKNVIKTDFGKPFAEEVGSADNIIKNIKNMEPIDAMKEANSVIGRKGVYKNLTPEESKKILKDTEDHIFERDIPIDPEDLADGGVAGLLGEPTYADQNTRVPYQLGASVDTTAMQDPRMKNTYEQNIAQYADPRTRSRPPVVAPGPSEQEAKAQFQAWENTVKNATPQEHLSMGLHAGIEPTYSYMHEEGYPVDGPGPNIGRIENTPQSMPDINFEGMTPDQRYMIEGFDYAQPPNWSPGQPAPPGFKVVNMMGDTFLEPLYPSKEEMGRGPMDWRTPMGMMPPSNNFQDSYEGLSGQEYAEKYGIPYASGGRARQNFGLGGMSKRAFLKWLGSGVAGIGAAKSGLFSLLKGGGKKQVVKELATSAGSGQPPAYFFNLVKKIKNLGDEVTETAAIADRQKVTKFKDFELTEDLATGEKTIQRYKLDEGSADAAEYYGKSLTEETYMSYKPGETIIGKNKKPIKTPPEYEEGTAYLRNDRGNAGEIVEESATISDDVIKEGTVFEDTLSEFGKADGGRIGLWLGGGLTAGKGLTREMLKFMAKGGSHGKSPAEMLKMLNPKQFNKMLDKPEGIPAIAREMIEKYTKEMKADRANMIEDLIGTGRKMKKVDDDLVNYKIKIIEDMVSKGMDRKTAVQMADNITEMASSAAGKKATPKITDQGLLEMENIQKNLAIKDRKLNATGGRVPLALGKKVTDPGYFMFQDLDEDKPFRYEYEPGDPRAMEEIKRIKQELIRRGLLERKIFSEADRMPASNPYFLEFMEEEHLGTGAGEATPEELENQKRMFSLKQEVKDGGRVSLSAGGLAGMLGE